MRKSAYEMKDIEPVASQEGDMPTAAALEALLTHEGVFVKGSALLAGGTSPIEVIDELIPSAQALDLAGCPLNSIIYYLGLNLPVIADLGTNNAVLIVGFDSKNIIVMDPTAKTIYKKGMNDSAEWFSSYGNSFIAYVKTDD